VGLLPDAELKQFLDDLSGPAPGDPMVEAAALEESNPAKAETIYHEALAADEKNDPARLGLARVLAATGREDEALKTIESIPDAGEGGAEALRIRRTVEMHKAAATAG